MAQHNLRWAAEAVERHFESARILGVDAEEVVRWREAAQKMFIPYDERLGVTPQDDAFPEYAVGVGLRAHQAGSVPPAPECTVC